MDKEILVLGGTGYLGRKLIGSLEGRDDIHIVCATRNVTNDSKLNLNERVTVIPANLRAIKEYYRDRACFAVVNCACNYGKGEDLEVIQANLFFPLEVLTVLRESGTRRFITIGTGLPRNLNLYSYTKSVYSDFGKFFCNDEMVFLNIKLELFYGSDEPENRFLQSIICKMLKGADVMTTIGTQRRDIVSINDVVYALKSIIVAMTMETMTFKGYNEIPIGTGTAPCVYEIIDYIWELTGKKSEVIKGAIPMRDNEPDCIADCSIISALCDWNPLDWRKGVLNMVNDIRRMQK